MAASFPHSFCSSVTFRWLHRITEWWRIKGTLRDRLVQLPCSKQGQLEHVAQDLIRSGFVCLHGGDSTTSPDNLFQYLTTFTIKRFSSAKVDFPVFPFVSIASCLVTGQH